MGVIMGVLLKMVVWSVICNGCAQDLSQLVLVVADGRLHEKDALRARVRELASKPGVCVVFIAIDAPPAPNPDATTATTTAAPPSAASAGSASASLLDMQAVSFQGGKPVFKRYMDDFPFPYYVLLRDIAALPRTLADLLRQWFELSAAGGMLSG
jgi:midasin